VVDIVKAVCSQAGSEKRNISGRELQLKLCDSRGVCIARFTLKRRGESSFKGRGSCATFYLPQFSDVSGAKPLRVNLPAYIITPSLSDLVRSTHTNHLS
jgi:hypothetical protein